MKFEVLYANGVQDEVELPGHTVVAGRDPACDLVLNDSKCSRRHAVVEMGPSGLSIRDNGSANGVFVNGKKIERSALVPGDIIRLGETVLTVVAESGGTVVMDEDEMDKYEETEDLTRPQDLADLPGLAPAPAAATPPAPAMPAARPRTAPPARALPGPPAAPLSPPPPPPPPKTAAPPPPMASQASAPPPKPRTAPPHVPSRTAAPPPPAQRSAEPSAPQLSKPPAADATAREAFPRPLTVSVLSVLWLLAGAAYGAVGLGTAIFGPGGGLRVAAGAAGVFLALLSGAVGLGLWTQAPWARLLQLALAGIGVFTCAFTLPSIAIIAYLLRPEIQARFAGRRTLSAQEAEKARAPTPELAFTLGIAGTLVFSVLLAAASAYLGRALWTRARGPVPEATSPPLAEPGRN